MKRNQHDQKFLRLKILFSVIVLLIAGHILAKSLRDDKQTAWIYVTGFYGLWLTISLLLLLKAPDIKALFRPSINWQWNLLFVPVIALVVAFIFIPNRKLLQWDYWLALNIFICLVNPFLEEMYWRGLVSKFSNTPMYSYLFSSMGFAASHPLLFGVNSPGVAGWIGFGGTFFIGSLFWFCYYKTKSLRGCVLTHFLVDIAGMAIFILADKAVLAPI